MNPELLLIAFTIGLSSTGHCIAMCGGISSALSSGIQNPETSQRILRLIAFHMGRISCYALIGLVAGILLNGVVNVSKTAMIYTHTLALVMVLLSGLYILGVNPLLKKVEEKLAFIWRALQPITAKFIAMENLSQAYAMGFIWGFLPCGMIYSTVLWSSTASHNWQASILMLAFGLGTMPALLLLNFGHQQVVHAFRRYHINKALGLLLIAYALISLLMKFDALNKPHQHTLPHDQSEQQQSCH